MHLKNTKNKRTRKYRDVETIHVSGQRRCEKGRVNARRNGMARKEHELE